MLPSSLPLSLILITSVPFLISPTYAYPNCNPALFGTPVENDCHDIFFDRPWTGNKGLASLDKYTHYFGAADYPSTRPADVARRHWERRVNLPRTWHDRECSALLTPNLDPTGHPTYDTAKYPDIAESSTFIIMACGHYDEMSITTGLMSGGSMDGAGPRFRLSLFLYHPRSRFADAIRADVAAGRAIDYGAITLAGPADANTNPFLDPAMGEPDQPESSSRGANRASSAPPARCGRSPYCSRATDCRNPGCRCVADGGINWWSSSCKAVLADTANAVGSSGVGRGLLENNKTRDAGTSSNSSAGTRSGMIGGDLLSDLPCPCNCTYVSKQCCGSASGIVHEEPAKHLGPLRAPTEALRCDPTTGGWRPKVVGTD
ncbi:MAG: hypothetical protein Q9173_000046 [Seirophora scorigena]